MEIQTDHNNILIIFNPGNTYKIACREEGFAGNKVIYFGTIHEKNEESENVIWANPYSGIIYPWIKCYGYTEISLSEEVKIEIHARNWLSPIIKIFVETKYSQCLTFFYDNETKEFRKLFGELYE